MTPLTPAERNALRLRTEKADEVFSGRTVGELILDVRKAHADASAGLLGASLDAILAQCIAEPLAETPVPPAVMELQKEVHSSRQRQQGESLQDVSGVKRRKASGWQWFAAWWHPRQFASRLHLDWLDRHDIRAGRTPPRRRR